MRYLIAVGLLVVIVGGLAGIKFGQISRLMNAGKQGQKLGLPPESVGTAIASEQTWESTLSAVGSVVTAKGVAVSNESPGVVTAIRFESGAMVRAGQVLVELDTSVERAQLASAQARKELATVSEGRTRQLVTQAAAPRSQLDSEEAQLKTSRADLSALQAQIERKTVRAPFAGRLGIRAVNLGQYLNPGTTVTTLEALGLVYVDFTVPQQALAEVSARTPVRITLSGVRGATFDGVIAAVDPAIDATTRSVRLRASVPNLKEMLRPGMFVDVAIILPQRGKVIAAPATAVVHAAYGDSVFVVEGGKVRQQFVRLGTARGDFVAMADGVKAGQELVTLGAFKLRNGQRVSVNNDVRPDASLTPTPGNR